MRRSRATREPVRNVDATWLRMDGPTSPLVINALLTYRTPVPFEALERVVCERLLRHERFRQRAVPGPLGRWRWERDPYFDPRNHMHRLALPAPGGRAALQALVGDLMSAPLDRGRPLWQMYVIEGAGEGTAVVARVHHAVGDGVALVGVLLGLTDEGESLPLPQVGVVRGAKPPRWGDQLRQLVLQARTVGHLVFLPSDPPSLLKQAALRVQKRVAWSGALPLTSIKAAARGVGAKVNDVLMAALAGSLRRYLEDHGGWEPGLEVRALVPVFVRATEGTTELGNHFGMVYLPLALSVDDPLERVRVTKARMDAIKASPEATVALGILGAIGAASAGIEQLSVDLFTRKASVLVTNVPGPPMPIHLAGAPVESLMVWAPASGHIGLSFSLLSYAGSLRLGVATDEARVAQPQELVDAFEVELERITAAVQGPE
jgi:diacylglycerol O-acyltransferase / wax synthase